VYQKLEPILAPFWEVFWEVVKVSLGAVVEIISMSFKVIWDVVSSWLTVFSEFLSFLINVFQWNWEEAFNNLVNIVGEFWEATINIFEDLWIDLPQIFENLKSVITWIWSSTFSWLKEICNWALDWISNKISSIWDSIQSARDAISSLWSDSSSVSAVGSRASWWVVLAWQTYRVNEIHGEYFRPSTNWTISVNPRNWSPNVNISFWDVILNNWDDANQFSERVRNVMMEVFRNKSLWMY
jgi:phage-related protein